MAALLAFLYLAGPTGSSSFDAGSPLEFKDSPVSIKEAESPAQSVSGTPDEIEAPALGIPDTAMEPTSGIMLADGSIASVRFDKETDIPSFLTGLVPAKKSDPYDSAIAFFSDNRDLYRMSEPKAELAVTRQEVDSLGMTHLHMQQSYFGVPVFGADMAVHYAADGRIVAVNGRYVPGIALDVEPDLPVETAVETAQADLGFGAPASSFEPPELVVLASAEKARRLTWKVTLADDTLPLRMVYFIDAHTGKVAARYDALITARNRRTYTASNGTSLPGTLLMTEGGSSGDSVAQNAHTNIGLTWDYYYNTHGRDSYNGTGGILTSTVHYGSSYNNAFWNGYQMTYGDGDGYVFSPLGNALDVVAHELSHGVTQYTADLVYSYESGALNESYSDVFGAMVDRDDWLMGEDVYTPGIPGDALRSLSNPTLFGQPDHMNNYVNTSSDNGGVHTNSGIPNKAAYNVAVSIGKEKMERIWYRALTLYLNSGSQFSDARDASVQAATDLYGAQSVEVTAVINGFAAVGIGGATQSDTTARVEINHTYRGDLVVTLGVGDPDNPLWSTVISNRSGGSANNINATVDIAGGAAHLPPGWQNRWFLKVYDAAGYDEGAITKFTITDHGSTYTATDVPVAVTDYDTSISYIPTSDAIPPTVTSTVPLDGAMAYARSNVSASFSEDMLASSINSSSFTLARHSDGAQVPAEVSYDGASDTAVLDPDADLEYSTTYDATIATAITDAAGNPLTQSYTWSFTTAGPPRNYYFTWYDQLTPGMLDWVVMGNPSTSSSAIGFDVLLGAEALNASPYAVDPEGAFAATFPGEMGGPVRVESLDAAKAIISKRSLYGDSFEEIKAIEESSLDSHYYFTWYDARSRGARDWVLISNPGATEVEADIYIAGQKMNIAPYIIAPGGSVTPEFSGVMGGPVEIVAYAPGSPSTPRNVIASQRVLWDGNFNEVAGIPAAGLSNDYLFTWYDQKSAGATTWVLVSNPDPSRDLVVEITVAGQKMANSATGEQYYVVAPGGSETPTFPGVLNGPVEVKGYDAATYNPASPGSPNMNFYTTQRTLFGSSFGEIAGFSRDDLAARNFFSWYDQASRGSVNWVLVTNPGTSDLVAEIWIGGQKKKAVTIGPGETQTPTFDGVMAGPVEIRGYDAATYDPETPGAPDRSIFSSQRVLWNGHFNEVAGVVVQ